MITKANWTDFSSAEGSNALSTINRVLPPWISLLLAIVIGWQIARIIWMLVPAPAAGDAVIPPMDLPAATAASGGGADVQAIARGDDYSLKSVCMSLELLLPIDVRQSAPVNPVSSPVERAE